MRKSSTSCGLGSLRSLAALLTVLLLLGTSATGWAKKRDKEDEKEDKAITSSLISGLKFRNIGPAFASGRIADFAVNPDNPSEFYVGVASGNIWKTTNNGITFKPIFENYGSYSIGCLAMDPNNPHVIWAGTGENNHQRALAYGDGVYKSMDGGKSWKNMGLKESRQIGMIAIDPRNSDVVYVAAEGSVWGPGGQRGLYKTTDGGETWNKVLEISEHTGVNNVIFDPRNPEIMYATTEQRRRHVHTKIGGGPESAIYKSTDAGANWRKLSKGLPSGHVGGIGIAISPVDPDVLYAIIEAERNSGGFFRSTDRGESWVKRSSHHSSGQYYNEIYCDPVDVNKVYSMETVSKVTKDGGKTWERLGLKARHVDDHALWINPDNTDHFIIGGDGGVYITHDAGENYRHVSNLPITQYYRVTVDNSKPFYWVYGGTQDNNSMGGPSRTIANGVVSDDWVVTLGGDGFWNRVDPKNPDIVYSEYQYGNVYRYDKKSAERIFIKPQPRKGELTYRWNWNAPLIISPHKNTRLYIAANKLFRTNDRGNSWEVISPDLTAQIDRNTWPVMGKYWGPEAVAKDVSTSQYNTIVSLDESPVQEGLLYVGTDDGVIQVSEEASEDPASWRKIASFPEVPEYTYVSDIFADRFDENVVYASFDNRKRDDFKPYLLKSTDKGMTWEPIVNGLPENGTVHTIEQDFENPNLLFVGTEFGVFFSPDRGESWTQMKAGLPTIAVRDLAIHEGETDLVLATFGRGFYILDDYSPLRKLSEQFVEQDAHLFDVPDALMFMEAGTKYGQGSTYYVADNPPVAATFTYYMKETPKTEAQMRRKKEKELFKDGKPIPQPTWRELELQKKEIKPYLLFTITDEDGHVVRRITSRPSKGINRVHWDLRHDAASVVNLKDDKFNPLKENRGGMLIVPGTYKVTMGQVVRGTYTELAGPIAFETKPLNNTTLPAPDKNELLAFQKEVAEMARVIQGTQRRTEELIAKVNHIKQAILATPGLSYEVMERAEAIEKELEEIRYAFEGDKAKASWEEIPPQPMPIQYRLYIIIRTQWSSTSAVTETSRNNLEILKENFPPIYKRVKKVATEDILQLERELEKAKAPWTPERLPEL